MKLNIYPAVSEMQIANRRAKHFGDILKLLHCISLLGKHCYAASRSFRVHDPNTHGCIFII